MGSRYCCYGSSLDRDCGLRRDVVRKIVQQLVNLVAVRLLLEAGIASFVFCQLLITPGLAVAQAFVALSLAGLALWLGGSLAVTVVVLATRSDPADAEIPRSVNESNESEFPDTTMELKSIDEIKEI